MFKYFLCERFRKWTARAGRCYIQSLTLMRAIRWYLFGSNLAPWCTLPLVMGLVVEHCRVMKGQFPGNRITMAPEGLSLILCCTSAYSKWLESTCHSGCHGPLSTSAEHLSCYCITHLQGPSLSGSITVIIFFLLFICFLSFSKTDFLWPPPWCLLPSALKIL